MKVRELPHELVVHRRRVDALRRRIAALLPPNSDVIDVGCGDGLLARKILDSIPGICMRGLDVLARPNSHIPVELFDGERLPVASRGCDVVLLVDVLHHTTDPAVLVREAARVARHAVIIKDHLRDGLFADRTLRFMDWVGNAKHGVALPYNYWSQHQWLQAFAKVGLEVESWQTKLGLYSPPASWFFERGLHFLARLKPGLHS